jgi:acetoacetyl-CoA reductase/3-oxoacyl-[acyl-carrier protein] reductase
MTPSPDERLPPRSWSLRDRVALVTGAGGGIGTAIVRALLDAGAEVLAVDRQDVPVPDGAKALPCDLSDGDAVARLWESFSADHDHVDVVVHCAGITRDRVLWKMEPEAWDEVLRTNLDSAFHLLRGATPRLRAAGAGSVVLVTSINGERGKFGQANYAASKAGLVGLGRTAARELGRFGVRVNMVAPGMIRTAMTDQLPAEAVAAATEEAVLGRLGEPDDVAAAVLFLATDASRHVTGQVLRVDGGQLIA